jgi:hypothetical protein
MVVWYRSGSTWLPSVGIRKNRFVFSSISRAIYFLRAADGGRTRARHSQRLEPRFRRRRRRRRRRRLNVHTRGRSWRTAGVRSRPSSPVTTEPNGTSSSSTTPKSSQFARSRTAVLDVHRSVLVCRVYNAAATYSVWFFFFFYRYRSKKQINFSLPDHYTEIHAGSGSYTPRVQWHEFSMNSKYI